MNRIVVLVLLFNMTITLSYPYGNLHMDFARSEKTYEITNCVKIAVGKLFDVGESINVVLPKYFVRLYDEGEMLKGLEEYITIKIFGVYNEIVHQKNPPNKIPSAFLVLFNDREKFQQDFNSQVFKDSSKFLIVINDMINSLQNFSQILTRNGFKKVAFLQVGQHQPNDHVKNNSGIIANCQQVLRNPDSIQFLEPKPPPVLQFVKIINDDFVPSNGRKFKRKKKKNMSFAARLLSPIAEKFSMELKQHTETWEWNATLNLMKRDMVNIIYAPDQQNITIHLNKLTVLAPVEFDSVYVVDLVRPASLKYFTFAQIFTTRVWYCTISAFIAVILLSLFLNKFQPAGTKQEFIYFSDIFMMTLSQAIPHAPTKSSFRFGVGMWIFFVYIMTIVFNDNYRSTITGLPRIKLLRTFEDAIESGRIIYGSEYYVNLLRNSTDRRMADFGRRCEISPSQNTLDKILHSYGLGLLRQSDVLGHNNINRAIASEQLYFLTSTQIFTSYSILFTKNDDYFNQAYGEVVGMKRAMGILNKIRTDYNKEKYGVRNVRLMEKPTQSSSIKLLHLIRVLKYLYGGYLIATVVFFLEIIIDRVKS